MMAWLFSAYTFPSTTVRSYEVLRIEIVSKAYDTGRDKLMWKVIRNRLLFKLISSFFT